MERFVQGLSVLLFIEKGDHCSSEMAQSNQKRVEATPLAVLNGKLAESSQSLLVRVAWSGATCCNRGTMPPVLINSTLELIQQWLCLSFWQDK